PLLTTRPDDPDERTRSLPDYLDALEKIKGVDAPVARPGHGDPVTDIDGRVAEILEHHREREERVANILAAEGPMTAYDVTQELFPDLPATELFPGMSETIGHLDLLEDEDRVAIEERDGVVTYDLAD
ncbi:MAG: MBL fold metallo-hydrolase, partial [Haloarculaceae archaeon]